MASITKSAGLADELTAGGDDYQWLDEPNVYSHDGVYATTLNNLPVGTTKYLYASSFGFEFAAGDTIDGILFEIEGHSEVIAITDWKVRAVKGSGSGPQVQTTELGTGEAWPISDAYRSFGGPTDLLGTTWPPADVNHAGFGFAIAITYGDEAGAIPPAWVDHIRCTVYYTSAIEPPAEPPDRPPAYSGSEGIVGFVRESTWGTTPVTGSDPDKRISGIRFFPCKHENIQGEIGTSPATDDMVADREINRIVKNASLVRGSLRFIPGAEILGHLFTMMLGQPASASLGSGAYRHIWWPGRRTRAQWPIGYSLESQYANANSKLVQGMLISNLALNIGGNGPMVTIAQVMGKKMVWLYPDDDATHGSGTSDARGNTRPAVMTPTATLVTETPWHFKHIDAYPTINGVDDEGIRSLYIEPGFVKLEGLFTSGSGADIGTFAVDNFRLTGRMTKLFQTDTDWELFEQGTPFEINLVLTGDLIGGSQYEKLTIDVYRAKAATNGVINQIGSLTYDFGWTAEQDPLEAKSCQFQLVNRFSSYA